MEGVFLAVGRSEETIKVVVRGGFFMADGALLQATRWEMCDGVHLDPQLCRVQMKLARVPFTLCGKMGLSLLLHNVGRVEGESARLVNKGRLFVIEVTVWVLHEDISTVLFANVDGGRFW